MKKKLKNYGGNLVSNLVLGQSSKTFFAKKPYIYFISELQISEVLAVNNLKHGSIYLLEKENNTKFAVKNSSINHMNTGDCIQFQNTEIEIKVLDGLAKFLIAGIEGHFDRSLKKLTLNKKDDLYKVNKPWGYEVWINGEHPAYAFKKIFIKKENKTSLQYHKLKQETNVLFEGNANLHYKINNKKRNDEVDKEDIGLVNLTGINSIDVKPPTLHRIEAVTDIVLYEISTSHLDDVIRVNDDTSRPDGRIDKEHKIE